MPPTRAENELLERVVLDASALLSGRQPYLLAGVDLRYYVGIWSSWIVSEVTRKRTEWIAERSIRAGDSRLEMRRHLRESRERVNALLRRFSGVLQSVDYSASPRVDLSWLRDPDDWPVMQTALAAKADILVTDNASDFPLGELRHGILFLGSSAFLQRLYEKHPDAESSIRAYLRQTLPQRE